MDDSTDTLPSSATAHLTPEAFAKSRKIPRAAMDIMLKEWGLGGVAELPTKLAMFMGHEAVPEEAAEVAAEIQKGEALVLSLSAGKVALHFVVM